MASGLIWPPMTQRNERGFSICGTSPVRRRRTLDTYKHRDQIAMILLLCICPPGIDCQKGKVADETARRYTPGLPCMETRV